MFRKLLISHEQNRTIEDMWYPVVDYFPRKIVPTLPHRQAIPEIGADGNSLDTTPSDAKLGPRIAIISFSVAHLALSVVFIAVPSYLPRDPWFNVVAHRAMGISGISLCLSFMGGLEYACLEGFGFKKWMGMFPVVHVILMAIWIWYISIDGSSTEMAKSVQYVFSALHILQTVAWFSEVRIPQTEC